jgi:hypothetical protein
VGTGAVQRVPSGDYSSGAMMEWRWKCVQLSFDGVLICALLDSSIIYH